MPVVNPYAKRKAPPPPQPGTTSNVSHQPSSSSTASLPLHHHHPNRPPRVAVTTFSQAFSHPQVDGGPSTTSSAEQCPPAAAATATSTTAPEDRAHGSSTEPHPPPPGGNESHHHPASASSDRDHHVYLDANPHALYASHRQIGNGLLRHIRHVPWTHARMVPDYIWGTTKCALFLSLKYHALHPHYLSTRLAELGHDFVTRILLVLVDVQDSANLLLQLNVLCVRHNLTLVLVWSDEEAARYLETYKALEGKDATAIQRQMRGTFAEQVIDVLLEAGSVNKTDTTQLLGQFGSIRSLVAATTDEFSLVSGMGPVKVQKLYDAFHKPFSSKKASEQRRWKRQREEAEATEGVEAAAGPTPNPASNERGDGDQGGTGNIGDEGSTAGLAEGAPAPQPDGGIVPDGT